MPSTVIGELLGWDVVIVLVVILVLFGGSKLPKLARSLGEAKKEFEQGVAKSDAKSDSKKASSAKDDSDS